MKYDLVIKNGLVCTENGMFSGGIGVKNGVIAAMLPEGVTYEADSAYDAQGNIIFPGVVEPHAHLGLETMQYDRYASDLRTETRAAAQGGITTINTTTLFGAGSVIEYLDNAMIGTDKLAVNVKFYAAPGNDSQVGEMKEVFARGIGAFKFLLGYRGESARMFGMDERGIDTGMMLKGFSEIARLGPPAFAMIHAEDPGIVEQTSPASKANQTNNYLADFNRAQPSICEVVDICKAAYVANEVGCPLYVVHVSAKESVDQIAYLKAKGFDITGETCLHYLMYSCDDPVFVGNEELCKYAKVNPPIRQEADKERLWKAINEGTITCLGTDHVDYTRKKKLGPGFWETVCGVGDGYSVSLMLMFSEGVNKNRITIDTLRKIMCENPAKSFGLYPKKGVIAIGSDADIVIIDPKKEMTIDHQDSESANEFSIYQGWKVKGVPTATFVSGNLVAENYKIVTDKYHGKLLSHTNLVKVV